MIAEQDFILRIRRIHRLGMPQTVLNVIRALAQYDEAEADKIESAIRALVLKAKGDVHVMANGDLFVILPPNGADALQAIRENVLSLVMPKGDAQDRERAVVAYALPNDYMPLRERANTYVELARTSEHLGSVQRATRALQAEDVRGPLTAWSLSQVETLLDNIDIKRYVRTQPVYCQGDRGVWEKEYIDFFVSVVDLKRERFPRLNLETPQRLFLELCYTLDRKLLLELASYTEQWETKHISLNLSVETVLSPAFAQFCHVLPKHRRNQVNFEIHRSEIFLNFTTTRNALTVLKEEGFKVGIDGITASVLPYIQFSNIGFDYFKINVSREKWPEMRSAEVAKALKMLPVEHIVFSHCDHDEALQEGQKLGVRHFQGWLIDDVANAIIS